MTLRAGLLSLIAALQLIVPARASVTTSGESAIGGSQEVTTISNEHQESVKNYYLLRKLLIGVGITSSDELFQAIEFSIKGELYDNEFDGLLLMTVESFTPGAIDNKLGSIDSLLFNDDKEHNNNHLCIARGMVKYLKNSRNAASYIKKALEKPEELTNDGKVTCILLLYNIAATSNKDIDTRNFFLRLNPEEMGDAAFLLCYYQALLLYFQGDSYAATELIAKQICCLINDVNTYTDLFITSINILSTELALNNVDYNNYADSVLSAIDDSLIERANPVTARDVFFCKALAKLYNNDDSGAKVYFDKWLDYKMISDNTLLGMLDIMIVIESDIVKDILTTYIGFYEKNETPRTPELTSKLYLFKTYFSDNIDDIELNCNNVRDFEYDKGDIDLDFNYMRATQLLCQTLLECGRVEEARKYLVKMIADYREQLDSQSALACNVFSTLEAIYRADNDSIMADNVFYHKVIPYFFKYRDYQNPGEYGRTAYSTCNDLIECIESYNNDNDRVIALASIGYLLQDFDNNAAIKCYDDAINLGNKLLGKYNEAQGDAYLNKIIVLSTMGEGAEPAFDAFLPVALDYAQNVNTKDINVGFIHLCAARGFQNTGNTLRAKYHLQKANEFITVLPEINQYEIKIRNAFAENDSARLQQLISEIQDKDDNKFDELLLYTYWNRADGYFANSSYAKAYEDYNQLYQLSISNKNGDIDNIISVLQDMILSLENNNPTDAERERIIDYIQELRDCEQRYYNKIQPQTAYWIHKYLNNEE